MSCFLSLSFRLISWSTEALWVHFPVQASKTLSRRLSAPSPHWEGLREQSKPRAGALLAFCVNQGISASFSLLYFLISRFRSTRFRSIKGPQHWSLLKVMSTVSMMPSVHLILCRPLLLPSSIFPSIRVFSNESVLRIRWPKDWSFNFSISPSNEYSGLIFFRMDWLDLLAVQGTLKSLLQHHSSKASILWCSVFFLLYAN